MTKLIYNESNKQRLDKFLSEQVAGTSRSQIQKLIKDGKVLVDGQLTSAHYFLKTGQTIEILELETEKIKSQTDKKIVPPEIIAQTEDYLVINKPSGLIVHGGPGIKEPTLADWLIKKFPQTKTVGENPSRPGLVHRLDKEVSGLMVVALNQPMFLALKKQFQKHQVKKEYLALVHGQPETDSGQIDFPLQRSELTGKIVAKPKGEPGRDALTEFTVKEKFVSHTFLSVIIKTGRTHQIRAHLQAYGHPLVGDQLYKNKKIKDKINLSRIFLHSHSLGFYDLENNWQEFNQDLPEELKLILKNLV